MEASRVWTRDGTQRACVSFVDESGTAKVQPAGWVTLQLPALPETRPEHWPSRPMAKPRAAAPPHMTPVGAPRYALADELAGDDDPELLDA